jgi:C1A family cysteine protease
MISKRKNTTKWGGLGWKPSLPRLGVKRYVPCHDLSALPDLVDMRPQCPPVYDQGDLGSCHDPITEVLTNNGWKLFSELAPDDKLASVDLKTKKLIFELPTRVVCIDYDGDMYYGNHVQLDFAVTENHNMVVRKWNQKIRKLDEDYSLTSMKSVGWYSGLMTSVNYDGESQEDFYILKGVKHKMKKYRNKMIPMSAWLKFLGIFIAEGTLCCHKSEKVKVGSGAFDSEKPIKYYMIQLAAIKEREREFICNTLDELDLKYCKLKDRIKFNNKMIFTALEKMGFLGTKAPFKFVPDFIFNLHRKYILDFLEGHFMGDGCLNSGQHDHYTSSKQLADDLQRLIFLAGGSSHVSVRKPRTSNINNRKIIGKFNEYRISMKKNNNLSIDKKEDVKVQHYKGKVYCAEVPTYHTLVTRRNYKILISGNCTANSISGLAEFLMMKEGHTAFVPSRLAIYYWERVIEGTVSTDSGASISDSIEVVSSAGCPPESEWWYNVAKFAVKPNQKVADDATQHVVSNYSQVDNTNLQEMQSCLASGYPITIGFTVYESFESQAVADTGIVPMPKPDEEVLGGHAVLIVGYDNNNNWFIVRNSWSSDWGDNGYFYMPYAYFTNSNLASDAWTADTIS